MVRKYVIAHLAQDLRQGGGIAEHIRLPEFVAGDAKLLAEEALPVQELAHQRLAGGEVAVRFHPRTARRDELPGFHLLLDLLVQLGVLVFHPLQLLGLRAGKFVLGVIIHQAQAVEKVRSALALRLGQRPQPGGVDVGVADARKG